MMRQYHASPRRGGDNPYGVGIIASGSIYYLQDESYWRDRFKGRPICREPWIVEAFLNGSIGAARLSPLTGKWENRTAGRRSDIAIVRSLRDGRRRTIAVRILILHDERGLSKEPTAYPTLPKFSSFKSFKLQRSAA